MPSYWDNSVYCSPVWEPASLDYLVEAHNSSADGAEEFDVLDPASNLETSFDNTLLAAAVEQFISTLSARDKAIVGRVFWLGESQADVARDLLVSRMAVSKALKRIFAAGHKQLLPFQNFSVAN